MFFRRIGCRDLITLLLADLQEFRIAPDLSADQSDIARTCIMIVIMKPVRIGEIGIIAAKAFTFFVQLLNEPVVIMSGSPPVTSVFIISLSSGFFRLSSILEATTNMAAITSESITSIITIPVILCVSFWFLGVLFNLLCFLSDKNQMVCMRRKCRRLFKV